MDLCIFSIVVATPAGTRNPWVRVRKCTRRQTPPKPAGCGCRNAPAGLAAGGFFPTPRVCLRAGFRQTRTRIRGCHPYLCTRKKSFQQIIGGSTIYARRNNSETSSTAVSSINAHNSLACSSRNLLGSAGLVSFY